MKSLQWLSPALFLLIFGTAVYAQIGAGSGNAGGFIGSTINGGIQGQKGIPFSADVVNETTRVLPDGNRIHRETHGKTFRDSEGRTRNETETALPDGSKRVQVTIIDPVQQAFIFLDPQTNTATVSHFKQPTPVDHVVANLQNAAPVAPVGPQTPPKREAIGTKEIEGFTVSGTRMTMTTDAGRIGNEKPIVSVHETWFSEDLKMALLTTRDDPQSGQDMRRVTNIRTGDPDPLLFQIPADYTVRENR